MMKTTRLVLVLSLALLSGCAHRYVVKLNNGSRVTTTSKPRLVQGNYCFKDATGREVSVPMGSVREIAPASMSKEYIPSFKSPPAK